MTSYFYIAKQKKIYSLVTKVLINWRCSNVRLSCLSNETNCRKLKNNLYFTYINFVYQYYKVMEHEKNININLNYLFHLNESLSEGTINCNLITVINYFEPKLWTIIIDKDKLSNKLLKKIQTQNKIVLSISN